MCVHIHMIPVGPWAALFPLAGRLTGPEPAPPHAVGEGGLAASPPLRIPPRAPESRRGPGVIARRKVTDPLPPCPRHDLGRVLGRPSVVPESLAGLLPPVPPHRVGDPPVGRDVLDHAEVEAGD